MPNLDDEDLRLLRVAQSIINGVENRMKHDSVFLESITGESIQKGEALQAIDFVMDFLSDEIVLNMEEREKEKNMGEPLNTEVRTVIRPSTAKKLEEEVKRLNINSGIIVDVALNLYFKTIQENEKDIRNVRDRK